MISRPGHADGVYFKIWLLPLPCVFWQVTGLLTTLVLDASATTTPSTMDVALSSSVTACLRWTGNEGLFRRIVSPLVINKRLGCYAK